MMKTDEVVIQVLLEVIPELKGEVVLDDSRLTELGANSIDRADIILGCMERLGISGPVIEGAKCSTIGEVKEFLNARR